MVYLFAFTIFYHYTQPNVGKYTYQSHGWYGIVTTTNHPQVGLDFLIAQFQVESP